RRGRAPRRRRDGRAGAERGARGAPGPPRRAEERVSPRTADVVIVGAGVMGASIAFQLAQKGAGRIVVLDKEHVAAGGRGRSSALVRMHYSHPPEVQLALLSLEMFRAWPELLGCETHFRKTGFIRVVNEAEIDRLHENVAMQRALGVDTRVLSGAELAEVA